MKTTLGQTSGWASLVGRAIAGIVAAAALVVGLMFSMVLFAIALVVGICVFGWMWWKVRRALKQAQADPLAAHQGTGQDGEVIEGEIISSEWKDNKPR